MTSTHGSDSSFLLFSICGSAAVERLGLWGDAGLNHLMASSHTPSGQGRFDVLQNSGSVNSGRMAGAVR
jgi:hypothetical protein